MLLFQAGADPVSHRTDPKLAHRSGNRVERLSARRLSVALRPCQFGNELRAAEKLLHSESCVEVLDRAVTLAGSVFQPFAIDDLHVATGILNQARTLEDPGRDCYRGAP